MCSFSSLLDAYFFTLDEQSSHQDADDDGCEEDDHVKVRIWLPAENILSSSS